MDEGGWERVEARLQRYPAIADHFRIPVLRSRQAPYHVHYMAWRLGTWTSERNFEALDRLLAFARELHGWSGEAHLLTSADFGHYWGLLWQMQVAAYFVAAGAIATWVGNGPDLAIRHEGTTVYVECYTYQKRFGVEAFITEVMRTLDPAIRVEHNLCMPIALPRNLEAFLDGMFRPFLDGRLVVDAKQKATTKWPVLGS